MTEDTTNVFVKFLPADFDDSELLKLFSPFGVVLSAKVMLKPQTRQSLGYGFVKFSTKEEAETSIKNLTGCKLDNKTLMCKFANTCCISTPSTNLYIKPLPSTFTEDALKSIFEEFGKIISIKIVRDSLKPDCVIGLVRYEETESAMNALHKDGTAFIPNWPPVTVKYAESDKQRADRKASKNPPPKQRSPRTSPRGQSTNVAGTQNSFSPNYSCPPETCYVAHEQLYMVVAYPHPSYLAHVWQGQPFSSYQLSPVSSSPMSPSPAYSPQAYESLMPYGWYNPYDGMTYPCHPVQQ